MPQSGVRLLTLFIKKKTLVHMIESRTSSEGLISLNRLNHAVTHSLRSHFVLLKRIAVFCVWPFGMDRPNRLFCQTTRKLFTFAQ